MAVALQLYQLMITAVKEIDVIGKNIYQIFTILFFIRDRNMNNMA